MADPDGVFRPQIVFELCTLLQLSPHLLGLLSKGSGVESGVSASQDGSPGARPWVPRSSTDLLGAVKVGAADIAVIALPRALLANPDVLVVPRYP